MTGPDTRPHATTPTLGHRPALDGLRGVAILAVLGMNAGWPFLQGGFFGVDVFFVLSGFLITTLLLQEWQTTGTIDLASFFRRRALRLLPGLLALLLFATAYTLILRPAEQRPDAIKLILAALFYVSNWVISIGQVHGTLEHTWSLSVEVQFYLLWALGLTFALKKRTSPRALLIFCGVLFVLVALWRAQLWLQTHDLARPYMGLDTRADSLLVGCGVAFLIASRSNEPLSCPNLTVLPAWAVLLFCFAYYNYKMSAVYLYGFSLAGLSAGVLLWHAVIAPQSLTGRFLSLQPLTWFGRISYSLYLWHVPLGNVFSADRLQSHLQNPVLIEIVRAFLFIAVGCASYYGIERPFVRLKNRPRRLTPTPSLAPT